MSSIPNLNVDTAGIRNLVEALETAVSEAARTGNSGGEDGPVATAFRKLLEALGKTLTQFCKETETPQASAYRWHKGASAPRPAKLRLIRAWALPSSDSSQGLLRPVRFQDGFAGLWTVDYFFRRAEGAQNIFVIRTDGTFLAEDDKETISKLKDLLSENRELLIVYLCPRNQTKPSEPEQSFELLKDYFSSHNSIEFSQLAAQLQIHDLCCAGSERSSKGWRFDLGETSASTFVLEFRKDKQSEFKMEAQFLISIPVQQYSPPKIQEQEFDREPGMGQVFVEIPNGTRKRLWGDWSGALGDVAKECRKNMEQEQQRRNNHSDADKK